uniref:DUF4139 domain-containing protein n=1 Tax=Panagrolaimus sp. ES5 TaxID=591445 RepID=A0AC34GC04_9BILA
MILTYFGNVEQHTGEDWKNVELSLSTATPSSGGNLPKPGKTTVHLFRPPPIHPETGRYMMATKRARKSAPCTGGRIITPMNHATTSAKKNALSTTFTISNPKSIPTSSTSTIKVTITTQTFDAFLHFHCVPKKNANVFLMATIFNDSEYPFVYGPATVYVNDSMSGKIYLKSTSSGEKLECPLGVDKTVKVIYKPRDKFQSQVNVCIYTG